MFLDTNVILDLLGERPEYYKPMAKIATLADQGHIKLVASSLSYPTIFYVLSKYESRSSVLDKLRKFRILVKMAVLSETVIDKGLASAFPDFEDALQYYCALHEKCDIIITRSHKYFKGYELPVLSPDEYLISRTSC